MPVTPTKAALGLTAVGGTLGTAALVPSLVRQVQDYRRYKKVKKGLQEKAPYIAGAALAGMLAAGGGGYAYAKMKNGTYGQLPEAQDKSEKLKKLNSALFGRTGYEYLPGHADFVNGAGRRGLAALTQAKRELPQGALNDLPDRSQNLQYMSKAAQDAYWNSPAAPQYKKASMARMELLDKLGLSMSAAIPLGIAGATTLGGGLYLLGKKKLDPISKKNRSKLDKAELLDKYLLPGSIAAGALFGGITGAAAGKASGKRQRENLQQDLYNATASDYLTSELNRRRRAYTQAQHDLAGRYLEDQKMKQLPWSGYNG